MQYDNAAVSHEGTNHPVVISQVISNVKEVHFGVIERWRVNFVWSPGTQLRIDLTRVNESEIEVLQEGWN